MARKTTRVRISNHCRDRMNQRGIRERDVLRTYHNPDTVFDSDQDDDVKIYERGMSGGLFILRVIVNIITFPVTIITAYKRCKKRK